MVRMQPRLGDIVAYSGKNEDCTCTMILCPLRKQWQTSGREKESAAGSFGTNGSGCSNELRYLRASFA